MSKAIQSSTNAVTGVQGTAATQSADWLARMGSDGQGTNAGSFSRWMAQHTPQAQMPLPQAARTAQATPAAQTSPSASPTAAPTAASFCWVAFQPGPLAAVGAAVSDALEDVCAAGVA